MHRLAVAVVAVLAFLELRAPAFQDRALEFVAGVLRRDGSVLPFAAFDGRRWNTRWPKDIRNLDLPIALDVVPERWWGVRTPPKTMTIVQEGARAGTLTLTGIATTQPMCEARMTLKSDFKPPGPLPPPFERPYPKVGLVLSADVPVEPIQPVEPGSAAWNQVLTLLRDEFNREETVAARSFSSWAHPVKADQRKLVPIVIEALYRAPTDDPAWTAFYVEAVRQYPPGPGDRDGCGLATFGSGWVLAGPGDRRNVGFSAHVAYCDRKGASYMLPFGLIRANGHVYWLYQISGFDEEWYEVAEPTRRRIVSHVAYPAGLCVR